MAETRLLNIPLSFLSLYHRHQATKFPLPFPTSLQKFSRHQPRCALSSPPPYPPHPTPHSDSECIHRDPITDNYLRTFSLLAPILVACAHSRHFQELMVTFCCLESIAATKAAALRFNLNINGCILVAPPARPLRSSRAFLTDSLLRLSQFAHAARSVVVRLVHTGRGP